MCCVVSVLINVTQDHFMTRVYSGLSCGGKESFPCLTLIEFFSFLKLPPPACPALFVYIYTKILVLRNVT